MAKGPKRVKDFTFSARDGYSGSAGLKHVKGYVRGGPTRHDDAAQDKALIRKEVAKALRQEDKPERKAMGGIIDIPGISTGAGHAYVSPLRSQAARKAARTRRSSGGLKHLVD